MQSPLSISMALQPPSLHSLSTSRAREVIANCSLRGSLPSSSSLSSSSSTKSTSTRHHPTMIISSFNETKECNSSSSNVQVSSDQDSIRFASAVSSPKFAITSSSSSLSLSQSPVKCLSVEAEESTLLNITSSSDSNIHGNVYNVDNADKNHSSKLDVLVQKGDNIEINCDRRDRVPRDQDVVVVSPSPSLLYSSLLPLHSSANSHSKPIPHSHSPSNLSSSTLLESSIVSNSVVAGSGSRDSQNSLTQVLSGPNSVLWKAYSRVKQTITETQTANPLGTMSEYWYSLGSQCAQDQHIQIYPSASIDSQCMKLADTISFNEQFPIIMPQSLSPSGAPFSSSSHCFLNSTINDNCYSHHNDATATVTLSPSSIQLSSSLHTIAGSDSPSKPKSSNIHSVLSEDREAQELKLQSDDAGSLPELSETHGSCSEEDQVVQDQVQTRSNAPPPRAKFFLCDDSDDFESDMDQEPISYKFSSIKRSSLVDQEIEELDHDGDCEDFDAADDQHDDNEEEDYFGKKIPIITRSRYPSKESNSPHPTFNNANMGRRQSLLSDLLLAEKQQRSLQRVAVPLSSSSASNSKCPSANNSDGESAALHSNMAMNPMPSPQHQQHHRRESHMERNISEHKAVSPQLMRTKKVYKNLSELAKTKTPTTTSQQHYSENLTTTPTRKSSLSVSSPCAAKATAAASKNAMKTTTSTTTAIASPSLSSSPSPTVSTNSSCILSASPIVATNSWSRTQVQVQLQSLVAQSTSTAQRALMGASATLSDVLFRTAH